MLDLAGEFGEVEVTRGSAVVIVVCWEEKETKARLTCADLEGDTRGLQNLAEPFLRCQVHIMWLMANYRGIRSFTHEILRKKAHNMEGIRSYWCGPCWLSPDRGQGTLLIRFFLTRQIQREEAKGRGGGGGGNEGDTNSLSLF